jgi:hypothetical protein
VSPVFSCRPLETPLPGSGPRAWLTFWKLVRLIEDLPIP